MSIDRWRDIEDLVYIYNKILLMRINGQNKATCSNMDGPQYSHTKSDRERQISYGIT